MPYKPGDIIGKNMINRVNFFLDENIDDNKIILSEAPISWEAGSLLTTNVSGGWTTISEPITSLPIGIVDKIDNDGNTAVIRMTGSSMTDFPVLRTEPSHPSYKFESSTSTSGRPILPTYEPTTSTTMSGSMHFEGNAPEVIEQLQEMISPGSRLVVNGDQIWYAQGPRRTIQYNYSTGTGPLVKTKKTRKPRKKQERIKTIKDQLKDIP